MDETKTFTVTVTLKNRWVPHFLSMLKYMQYLGEIGSSKTVGIYADGDGDFQPKFKWSEELSDVAPAAEEHDGNRMYDAG